MGTIMSETVRLRHTVTNLTVEMPVAQYQAIAFTPLGKVFDVVPDGEYDCFSCGPTDEELGLLDPSKDENEDEEDNEEEGDFPDNNDEEED